MGSQHSVKQDMQIASQPQAPTPKALLASADPRRHQQKKLTKTPLRFACSVFSKLTAPLQPKTAIPLMTITSGTYS